MDNDLDLLASRLKTGDRDAAEKLVDIYYEQIYRFMRRLGHGRQASEDLTQETFMRAWQHIGNLRSGASLNGWLYQIAASASGLYWRRNKSEARFAGAETDPADHAQSVVGRAEEQEQLARLARAVAALPPDLRQVVVLHYLQRLTIIDAACAAGLRQGTFKSRLDRALKLLNTMLDLEK